MSSDGAPLASEMESVGLTKLATISRVAAPLGAERLDGDLGDLRGGAADADALGLERLGLRGGGALRAGDDLSLIHISEHVAKPVVAYIAGFTAPPGKTMGHAGAIVSGTAGTAAAKAEALEARGVRVGRTPTETAEIAAEIAGP